MTEPAFRSAAALAASIRAREVGSRELLEHYVERVERLNPALNAIIVSDFRSARRRAEEADAVLARGESWGPLHGLPMTVKESFDVIGLPTTWGLAELKDNMPTANALAVDRLLAAGAIIFGKTNVPVLLADLQSYNPVYGTTNNPWDTSRTPGGSSGGAAAALAAGLTGLELGSDIGGSIRNPAHYCGVFGHKPTYGIVPPRGQALYGNVAASDISVIGPLARSAEDLALALDIIAGPDPVEAAGWRLDLAAPRSNALHRLPHCRDARGPQLRGRSRGTRHPPAPGRFSRRSRGPGQRSGAPRHQYRGTPRRLHQTVAGGHLPAADGGGVPGPCRGGARARSGRPQLPRPYDARHYPHSPKLARGQ